MVEGHELVRIELLVVQLRLEDELVVCRYGGILFGKEFFIKLLAGTQPGDDYAASSVTVVLDEALGEVVDLHRLSHVEDHDLPTLCHGSCLEDETDGFGDGHEVADDVLMCDCYRDAGVDLVDEQRKHRTSAAEDVAEPDGDNFRPAAREHRGDQLDHPLGCSHDIGRVHGLVGGLVGFTALSVEMTTTLPTPLFLAEERTLYEPATFVRMISSGSLSPMGTCL